MKHGRLITLILVCICLATNVQAETITLEGRVEGKETLPFFVPFEGRIENVYIHPGDRISGGETLLSVATSKVYAPMAGTVSGLRAAPGDALQDIVLTIEPEHSLAANCSFAKAYKSNATQQVKQGEWVYLRSTSGDSPRRTGTGCIVQETNEGYTVQVTGGNLLVSDSVQVYRQDDYQYASCVGSGQVFFAERCRVSGNGTLLAMHVKDGQKVDKGDLLYETIIWDSGSQQDLSASLSAPEDCVIVKVDVSIGQHATVGQQAGELIRISDLCVKVAATEEELACMPLGQEVSISLLAFPELNYSGTVESISYLPLDPSARVMQYEVIIRFSADQNIRLKMGAVVEIERAEEACLSEENQ